MYCVMLGTGRQWRICDSEGNPRNDGHCRPWAVA